MCEVYEPCYPRTPVGMSRDDPGRRTEEHLNDLSLLLVAHVGCLQL